MRKKITKKFHRTNKNGEIVEEKFTSVLHFLGIKINEEDHLFQTDDNGTMEPPGFKPTK